MPDTQTTTSREEINLNFLRDVPHIDGFVRMKLSENIHEVPVRSALRGEQLIIHVRAYDEGYNTAMKHLKQDINSKLQLALFGHVL